MPKLSKYRKPDDPVNYTPKAFWDKLNLITREFYNKDERLKEVMEKALLIYFVLQSEKTAPWAATSAVSALAYFIFPVDAICDLIPVFGYCDDIAVMSACIAAVASFVDDKVREQTRKKLREWF